MADRVGQQLGSYRLTHLLSDEGGSADVYLGEHIHLGTQAAIKVLTRKLTDEEIAQFRNEARTMIGLHHPNIVQVLDFDMEGRLPFIIMQYAPNGSLQTLHPRGTYLPLQTILPYVKQVASALQYAHDRGVIHRDVKPGNMLVGHNNDILLSDFGIAIIAHRTDSWVQQNIGGTDPYMAPEQFYAKAVPASDQYALGIAVYHWLCGELPFTEGVLGYHHNYTPPPPLHTRVPSLLPAVEHVVLQALAKDPQHRFASVQAFATALEQAYRSAINVHFVLPSMPSQPFIPFSSAPIDDFPTEQIPPVPPEDFIRTATSPMNQCPYCGDTIRSEDNFCLNCGNRLPPTNPLTDEEQPGTIGMRFMPTIAGQWETAPALPTTLPKEQIPIEDLESFTPDRTSAASGSWDAFSDHTIAQLLEEGENYYKAKHYEDALAVYIRIIRMNPRNVQAHGKKGNVLGSLRQYKEALAAYNAALDIDAKHGSIWNAKGDVLFKLRRYEEALKAYNAALSINPNDALTLTTKGDVLSRLRRYEEALAACNQALSITSTHTRAWITKGNVLAKQRHYEEALVAYDAALAINPKDASTWNTKGNVLSKLERYEGALIAYTCASDLAPRKSQIWAAKGEVLWQLKRYDEALIAYERSHILNPSDTAILRKCALLRDFKDHKDERAQAQAKEKPAETQAAEQPYTRVFNDNGPRTQQTSYTSMKGQEQRGSFGQGADSTRVLEGFDIFLSYAGLDVEGEKWVEDNLASYLEDEYDFRVWIPKWWLIPGMPWQPQWDRGMEQSSCYAICVSGQTSIDWFKQEVQKALKRKQTAPSFRVLAILLPDAQAIDADAFPELTTWVDFRNLDHAYAFHVLVCGVKGVPPGPPLKAQMDTTNTLTGTIVEVRLRELQQFKQGKLIDDSVAQEFQRIVLRTIWLDVDESKG